MYIYAIYNWPDTGPGLGLRLGWGVPLGVMSVLPHCSPGPLQKQMDWGGSTADCSLAASIKKEIGPFSAARQASHGPVRGLRNRTSGSPSALIRRHPEV